MEITWTASIDGAREPKLDMALRVDEQTPRPALLRALENELRWLTASDLPLAVYEVMQGRWS